MISIIQGDVIEILKDYPDESFVAVFTDPPYGLSKQPDMREVLSHWLVGDDYEASGGGFMGKSWDSFVPGPRYWQEIYRVLKPGAVLLAFCGTRTEDLLGISIRLAGFERFDTCAWVHAQGFPKSASVDKNIDKEAGVERRRIRDNPNARDSHGKNPISMQSSPDSKMKGITAPATDEAKIWEGYGTSLKPAIEFVLCFRKPRTATYAKTAMEHGTAALNIDGCRIPSAESYVINTWDDGAKPFGDGAGHPFTSRQQSGRWPANLILDEVAAEMLDEQIGERKSGYMKPGQRRKSSRGLGGYHGNFPDEATAEGTYGDSGGLSRFFYCTKSNKKEREMGLRGYFPCLVCGEIDTTSHINLKESRSIPCRRNNHTTIKPLALCKYLAQLIIPPEEYRDDANLLIPFAGVMSEAIGALLAGWRNITAIELEKEYCEIGQKRVDWWVAKIQETGLTNPKAILKTRHKEKT